MNLEDEFQLPRIPGAFEAGTIGPEVAYGTEYGAHPPLPQIPGVFDAGKVGPELSYGTEYRVDPNLPRIAGAFDRGLVSRIVPFDAESSEQSELGDNIGQSQPSGPEPRYSSWESDHSLPAIFGQFEGGAISDNTFRVEDRNLPKIRGLFERGKFVPHFTKKFVEKSTEFPQTSEIPQTQGLPSFIGSDSTGQSGVENISPWDISDPFSSQTLQSSLTPSSRFQRLFSESSPIDSQRMPHRFTDVSPIASADSRTDSSFHSFSQKGFDSGFGNIWSDFPLPASNLYQTDQNRSVQDSNLESLIQNIFSQTSSSTEQSIWPQSPQSSFETTQQGFRVQSLQPSSESSIDWAHNILPLTSQLGAAESHYRSQEVDIYATSKSIEEDIQIMATKGFIIEPNSRSQFTGSLLRGSFGPHIIYQTDIRDQPFTNFEVGQPFTVKFIEFEQNDSMSDTKREMFEIERYVLTFAEHPNIVSIRHSFNMGQHKECKYRNNPYMTFTSWDRQYIILESADLGDLETHLEDNILPEQLCISFIRQLCSGLKHLHDSYIFHCDIEPRNILLFGTNQSHITVKWCDFGISCILNSTHPSQPNSVQTERIIECRNYDLECLSKIYYQILMFSTSSDHCSQNIKQIINLLSNGTDLNIIQPMIEIF